MIPILLALTFAHAAPGRTVAGLSAAWVPSERPVWRGTLDYGLVRHLAVTGEAATLPSRGAVSAGLGPLVEVVDDRWWRLGLVALPEIAVSFGDRPPPGVDLGLGPTRFVLHGGVRVGWLAFWGLSVTGRADVAVPFGGDRPWTELGLGLAVRL